MSIRTSEELNVIILFSAHIISMFINLAYWHLVVYSKSTSSVYHLYSDDVLFIALKNNLMNLSINVFLW